MNESSPPIVVGLGELLWDVFADSRRPGGAPANVAFHAGQLGLSGIVATRVGRDELGDELLAFLQSQALSTDSVQLDSEHPTGTVTVDASMPDHPQYTIHTGVAWDNLAFDAGLERLMRQAAAVCFGTLAQRGPTSRVTIDRALAATGPQCLVVYDVNLRQQFYCREWIEASLRRSRIVKLNEHEVTELDGLLEIRAGSPEGFARAIQERFDVETVCITRADRGCLLIGRNETVDQPGVPVQVADAVGAGDAFTAALIAGQLRGWPLERQAAFANAVGALVASRPGAMASLREEFARLMDSL